MSVHLDAEQRASLRQAAHWFSQLNSGDVQASDYSAWQLWLNATPVNSWAWQQAERLQTRMAASENPLRHACWRWRHTAGTPAGGGWSRPAWCFWAAVL
ncbi:MULTISPECIES: DUF4880 domain-containing protein [Pseudomonas]|uniref:DUF4880 domain-containing protein n=1 Tax=Pseudomonas TaxID=286 RepID=UPI0021F842C0|nr:DUF4880 domain-containing protein [Pseudomonas putida]